MNSSLNIQSFVNDRLINSDRDLAPDDVFACAAIVYETPLINSFVQTVIDGCSRPASFANDANRPYGKLILSVKELAANEPSFAFYGRDPDNALSLLSWVRPCVYERVFQELASFELAPAEEGGTSWLGLIGKSKTWLLLHEFEPGESFKITAYGTRKFCGDLLSLLGIEHDAV